MSHATNYQPCPIPFSTLFLALAILAFASNPLRLDCAMLCPLKTLEAVLKLMSSASLAPVLESEAPPLLAAENATGCKSSASGLVGVAESVLATSLSTRLWPWKMRAVHACTSLKVGRCWGGDVRVAAICSSDTQGSHWKGTMEIESGVAEQVLSVRMWRRDGVNGVGDKGGSREDSWAWSVLLTRG